MERRDVDALLGLAFGALAGAEGGGWMALTKADVRPPICERRETKVSPAAGGAAAPARGGTHGDELDDGGRAVGEAELLPQALLLALAPAMPHQPAVREQRGVRADADRRLADVERLQPQLLNLLGAERRRDRRGVEARMEQDLVGDPVADSGSDRLVEQDALRNRRAQLWSAGEPATPWTAPEYMRSNVP